MLRYVVLFGHQFVTYDIIATLAAVAGFSYFSFALLKLKVKLYQVITFVLVGAAAQYFGGTILPFLYKWFYFHQEPWLNIWEKPIGRYFHSTTLSIIAVALIFIKFFKWPPGRTLDHVAIGMILASSIARIGCFLHGCCYGKSCDLPWAVTFPNHPEAAVHPTQIYMFVLETLLWVFLFFFYKKEKYGGQTFWMGVLLYSIYRIGIEFVRTNPVFLLGLTHAQVFSILTVALAFYMLWRNRKRPRELTSNH